MKMNGKYMCCLFAVILFFLGIAAEVFAVDSLPLHAIFSDYSQSSISSTEEIVANDMVCTTNMLRSEIRVGRTVKTGGIYQWQGRTVAVLFVVGNFLQFLYYQSSEGKEDGQLFACRTMIVDYIHLRDSGE